MKSLSERLLQAKAAAARRYQEKIGSLADFDSFWREMEPEALVLLDKTMAREQAAADDTEALDWRSDAQKAAFISEHGLGAFEALLVKHAAQGV